MEPEEYQEILGANITPDSFENFQCDATAANARCYATVGIMKYSPEITEITDDYWWLLMITDDYSVFM